MELAQAVEQLRLAWWTILVASGPILGVALAVGLAVGIVQAATSINESTLSFVPKLAVVLVTLALAGDWLLGRIADHFATVFQTIATLH
ncbi:flagellar biosynthesis protein FliQ [Frigidibacter oleivorans]|uniref:flagellar biosynthesis protein FliQ n=1 Tax=Frigidibacter oleivorans TaxID=2487129 RepID=UPI000F8EFF25|nr:flagellar biosynthesis protein FliQ [Frigidibacter oleivorans]